MLSIKLGCTLTQKLTSLPPAKIKKNKHKFLREEGSDLEETP